MIAALNKISLTTVDWSKSHVEERPKTSIDFLEASKMKK